MHALGACTFHLASGTKGSISPKPPLSHVPRILSEQEEGLSRKSLTKRYAFKHFRKKTYCYCENISWWMGLRLKMDLNHCFFCESLQNHIVMTIQVFPQWSCRMDHEDRHTCSTCTKFRTSNTSYVLSIKKKQWYFYHVSSVNSKYVSIAESNFIEKNYHTHQILLRYMTQSCMNTWIRVCTRQSKS